jgi:hypothetical protein
VGLGSFSAGRKGRGGQGGGLVGFTHTVPDESGSSARQRVKGGPSASNICRLKAGGWVDYCLPVIYIFFCPLFISFVLPVSTLCSLFIICIFLFYPGWIGRSIRARGCVGKLDNYANRFFPCPFSVLPGWTERGVRARGGVGDCIATLIGFTGEQKANRALGDISENAFV